MSKFHLRVDHGRKKALVKKIENNLAKDFVELNKKVDELDDEVCAILTCNLLGQTSIV